MQWVLEQNLSHVVKMGSPNLTSHMILSFHYTSFEGHYNKQTFGGCDVVEHLMFPAEDGGVFTGLISVIDNLPLNEFFDMPSLMATLAVDMKDWAVYKHMSSIEELIEYLNKLIYHYTIDIDEYIHCDDFDDYLLMLVRAKENLKLYNNDEYLKYYNE